MVNRLVSNHLGFKMCKSMHGNRISLMREVESKGCETTPRLGLDVPLQGHYRYFVHQEPGKDPLCQTVVHI